MEASRTLRIRHLHVFSMKFLQFLCGMGVGVVEKSLLKFIFLVTCLKGSLKTASANI